MSCERKHKSESHGKKFSNKFSNLFRKTSQISEDTAEDTMVDMEERNKETIQLEIHDVGNVNVVAKYGDTINHENERKNDAMGNLNVECHNDNVGLLHTSENIDNVPLNKMDPTEAKSTEDDSKLMFHNHHTNEQHTPAQLGDHIIMAVTQFGAS